MPPPALCVQRRKGKSVDEKRLRQIAQEKGWQIREGTSVPSFSEPSGYWHPFHVTAPSQALVDLINSEPPFNPKWPVGLEMGSAAQVACDDNGRDGNHWFRVWVAPDGDVHLMMQNYDQEADWLDPFPSIRIRTDMGGGRHLRTHQALLWLARAIQLDEEEIRNKAKLWADRA